MDDQNNTNQNQNRNLFYSFIGEVCSHIGNLALVYIDVSVLLKNRLLAMNRENKQWINYLKVNKE